MNERYVAIKFANKDAAFAIFDAINARAEEWSDKLATLGIARRDDARGLVLEWASNRYSVALRMGERGVALDNKAKKYEAAKTAVRRVLDVVFPKAEMPVPQRAELSAVDKLVKAYGKLTGAEKRSFLKAIGK